MWLETYMSAVVTQPLNVLCDATLTMFLLTNCMVTYSLRQPCSDLNSPNRTLASRFLCKPYGDLRDFCSPRGYRKPFDFFLNLTLSFFSETTTSQPHRKCIVRSLYGGLAMAARWHTVNPVLSASKIVRRPHGVHAAAARCPYGGRTANLWLCLNCEGAVRSPPGLLAVTSRFLISWIVRSPCGRRNICDHYYRSPQDLTIFKKSNLQTVDRRTVWRPYGGSRICDRGVLG